MATSKTYQTLFSIKGKYEAGPAFAKANQDLAKTEKHAHKVTGAFREFHEGFAKGAAKVATGFAAYELGAKAFDLLTDTIKESIHAAEDVEKAHQGLGAALERNWSLYKKTGQNVSQVTQSLIELAEKQEQVAFDAEDMEVAYTKLLDSMDPEAIKKSSAAFSDVVAKIKGVNATKEDMIDVATQWNNLLLGNKSTLTKQLGWTKNETDALKGLNYEQKKAALLEWINKRIHGETARQFETTAGKVKQMRIQLGNLYETLGKPFVDRAGSIADSLKGIAVNAKPIADAIAEITDKRLAELSKMLEGNKGSEIADRLKIIFDWLSKIQAVWDKINEWKWSPFIALFKAINSGEPARLPVIPGSPTGVNPALQQGEAGRRAAQAAIEASKRDKSKGFAPYTQRTPTALTDTTANVGALKDVRASFAQELADPAVRDKLMRVAQAEVGSGNPAKLQAFIETVLNQAASRHHTIAQTLSPAYYDTLRHGPLAAPTAAQQAKHEAALQAVLGGSNISKFSTGNWSGAVGRGFGQAQGGYLNKIIGGEQFGTEAADKAWATKMQSQATSTPQWGSKTATAPGKSNQRLLDAIQSQPTTNPWFKLMGPNAPAPPPAPPPLNYPKVSMEDAMMKLPGGPGSSLNRNIKGMNTKQRVEGATGGTNVASNPVINIHGVPAGQEGAVGREVQRAMTKPTRELLSQIKTARSYEARLGYV